MKNLLIAEALPPETSLDRWFETAARAGFAGVELAISAAGPLRFDTPQDGYTSTAKLAAQAGLSVPVLVASCEAGLGLASPDPNARAVVENLTRTALEGARWLGAGLVVLSAEMLIGRPRRAAALSYEDTRRLIMESLLRLRFDAQQHAVRLAIACGRHRFLPSPIETRGFVDRLNSPWAGVSLDIGGTLPVEDAADWVRSLGWRVAHVRWTGDAWPAKRPAAPPGDEPDSAFWPQTLAALEAMRYDGFCALASAS